MKLKCISSAATPICWKPLIQQVITQKIKKICTSQQTLWCWYWFHQIPDVLNKKQIVKVIKSTDSTGGSLVQLLTTLERSLTLLPSGYLEIPAKQVMLNQHFHYLFSQYSHFLKQHKYNWFGEMSRVHPGENSSAYLLLVG